MKLTTPIVLGTSSLVAVIPAAAQATGKIEPVALAARKPARLAWTRGTDGFAANRRVLEDGRWTGFGVEDRNGTMHRCPFFHIGSNACGLGLGRRYFMPSVSRDPSTDASSKNATSRHRRVLRSGRREV
jgi:hypothetical protein